MIDQSVFLPQLRVFRQLNTDKLSEKFIEKLEREEGSSEWVDANRARDFEWTDEVMSATVGAALVDAEGNIVAKWRGKDAFVKAEQARSSAKLTFSVDIAKGEETDEADEAE